MKINAKIAKHMRFICRVTPACIIDNVFCHPIKSVSSNKKTVRQTAAKLEKTSDSTDFVRLGWGGGGDNTEYNYETIRLSHHRHGRITPGCRIMHYWAINSPVHRAQFVWCRSGAVYFADLTVGNLDDFVDASRSNRVFPGLNHTTKSPANHFS